MLAGTSYASMSGFPTGSSQKSRQLRQTSEASSAKTVEARVHSWRKGDPAGSTGPCPPLKGTILAVFAEPTEPKAQPDAMNLLRKFSIILEKIICLEQYSRHFYQY